MLFCTNIIYMSTCVSFLIDPLISGKKKIVLVRKPNVYMS